MTWTVKLLGILMAVFNSIAAPVEPQKFEMTSRDPYQLHPMIESSIIESIPEVSGTDSPNFFWSGSGDDPDAGMTYWMTTTVFKTSTVTLVRQSSRRIATTTSTTPTPTTEAAVTLWPSLQVNCSSTTEAIQATPAFTTSTTSTTIKPTTEATNPPESRGYSPVPPQYWIQTVVESRLNESSATFNRLMEERLARVYSAALSPSERSQKVAAANEISVLIQNISRSSADEGRVVVLYALADMTNSRHLRLIDVEHAIQAMAIYQQGSNVSHQLCVPAPPLNGTAETLCRAVVTQAEAYLRAESVVAARPGRQFWIIGVVLGAILILALAVLGVYLFVRNSKRTGQSVTKAMQTEAVSVTPPPVVQAPIRLKPPLTKQQSIQTEEILKSTSTTSTSSHSEEAAALRTEAWLRKSRSTTQKDGRNRRRQQRPVTAPELKQRWNSSNNLPSIASPSSSERTVYIPSREEPTQASRSCRKLKKKKSRSQFPPPSSSSTARTSRSTCAGSLTETSSPEIMVHQSRPESDVTSPHSEEERPVPKMKNQQSLESSGLQILTEMREISAEFAESETVEVEDVTSGPFDVVANTSPQGEMVAVTLNTIYTEPRRRPGTATSLPLQAACNVISDPTRLVSSAPVRLLTGDGHGIEDVAPSSSLFHPEMTPKQAWTSSEDSLLSSPQPEVEEAVVASAAPAAVDFNLPNEIVTMDQLDRHHPGSPLRRTGQPLHIHSLSYPGNPAWPSLSESDPAIDLIKSIKDELKRFDYQ